MTRPHDLAADLPPPNPDEPATLRQDIVDELADHLTCAARQEALRAELDTDAETPDEQTIADRVLARFGDPRRIARRLWFDAMKGRLMMQKLGTAFSATAAAAAIAGCVILWFAVDSARNAVEQALAEQRRDRAQNAKINAQHEKANAALLAKLDKLAAASKRPRSMDWNPLTFHLMKGKDGGPPAVGYSVELDGPIKSGERDRVTRKAGPNGMVDFGLLRPGRYQVAISTPWNSVLGLDLQIKPGSETHKTVVCPDKEVVRASVLVNADLPKDLATRGCVVAVQFRRPSQRFQGREWTVYGSGGSKWFILQKPPGLPLFIGDWNLTRTTIRSGIVYKPSDMPDTVRMPQQGQRSRRRAPEEWKWVTATYQPMTFAILMPSDDSDVRRLSGIRSTGEPALLLDYAYFGEKAPSFTPSTVRDDEVELWNVPVPSKTIENARKRLKEWDTRHAAAIQRKTAWEKFVKNLQPTGTGYDKLSNDEKRLYAGIVRRYFAVMDRMGNGDGMLQENEWDTSQRIKPVFLKAKIPLKKDMTETEFFLNYVRLIGMDDPKWKQLKSFGAYKGK